MPRNGRPHTHRLRMERFLGRTLGPKEFVHHISGNHSDNRIENLMVVTPKEHRRLHPRTKYSRHERPPVFINGALVLRVNEMSERLGITSGTLKGRIRTGRYPPATFLNELGERLFDPSWVLETEGWKHRKTRQT